MILPSIDRTIVTRRQELAPEKMTAKNVTEINGIGFRAEHDIQMIEAFSKSEPSLEVLQGEVNLERPTNHMLGI